MKKAVIILKIFRKELKQIVLFLSRNFKQNFIFYSFKFQNDFDAFQEF
jgi:hypothetical protein